MSRRTCVLRVDVDFDDAIDAVYDALDPQDDLEYLAMLAIHEGLQEGDEPEELIACFIQETGRDPANLAEAER